MPVSALGESRLFCDESHNVLVRYLSQTILSRGLLLGAMVVWWGNIINIRQIAWGILVCLGVASLAANDAFDSRVFESDNGGSLSYRIYVPEGASADRPVPLVLFLHGAGERGSDNSKQLKHGMTELQAYTVSRKEPSIIVAPQCPEGKQ